MKVLIITGDKRFGPGNPRFELQKNVVERLEVVYWGSRSVWPKIPDGKFDVVTVQDPFWRGLFGWYVAKRKGAKFNVQVHTDLSVYGGFRHILMQIVLRHADSIRTVSEKIKKQVERINVKGKVSVLPIFIDVLKFSVVPREHTSKNILWIGRFEEEKNPLQAIEILKDVLKLVPEARLTMVGAGSYGPKLSEKASSLPVQTVEISSGWQDPVTYFDTADVVLCTSWHESWGAVMVEALAAGIPVVAPDVGIAKEAGNIRVVAHDKLAAEVSDVLLHPIKGELKLKLLSKEEWAKEWVNTL